MANAALTELKIYCHYAYRIEHWWSVSWLFEWQPCQSANQRPVWCVTSRRINQWTRVRSKVTCIVVWINWVKKSLYSQLVFEEDIKDNNCREQIWTGSSSGSSNSSETGSKEKPAGVLRTDLRRGAKLRYRQGRDRLRVPTGRRQSSRWSWTSSSTSLRNWHFNQPKNSVPSSSETSIVASWNSST